MGHNYNNPKTPFLKQPNAVFQPEPMSQAERIISKFNGARNLARALKEVGINRAPSSIYRWAYPTEKGGLGGVVPPKLWPAIIKAGRLYGILITPDDYRTEIL